MGTDSTFRLGVLGSGNGSNVTAIAEAIERGEVPAKIALVLSDVKEAEILFHANRMGIATRFINPGNYRTKLDEEAEKTYVSPPSSGMIQKMGITVMGKRAVPNIKA